MRALATPSHSSQHQQCVCTISVGKPSLSDFELVFTSSRSCRWLILATPSMRPLKPMPHPAFPQNGHFQLWGSTAGDADGGTSDQGKSCFSLFATSHCLISSRGASASQSRDSRPSASDILTERDTLSLIDLLLCCSLILLNDLICVCACCCTLFKNPRFCHAITFMDHNTRQKGAMYDEAHCKPVLFKSHSDGMDYS